MSRGSATKNKKTERVRNGVRQPPARKGTKPKALVEGKPLMAGDTLHVPADAARSLGSATIHIGDCREQLPKIAEVASGSVDLVFADPPFNWKRGYDEWDDDMDEGEYLDFTYDWIDLCVKALRPGGALWINIPDDWAAEIACFLKGRLDRKPSAKMHLENWCIWHYRFGQNAVERFINSKVHVFYFVKDAADVRGNGEQGTGNGKSIPIRSPLPAPRSPRLTRTWNPEDIAELSDRAAIYGDKRTLEKKDGMPPKLRVPLDVWYGSHFSRVQGNNLERRDYHDNQLPEMYLARVIRSTSAKSDVVMDPFTGSGTTGVVARALGRNFIGTEFSAENAARAMERIKRGPIRDVCAAPGTHHSAIYAPRAGREVGEMP